MDGKFKDFKEELRRKKEIEIENKRKRELEKIEFYKRSQTYKLFRYSGDLIDECPKKISPSNNLKKLKRSYVYKHPIIKRIVDGEYWNGKYYRAKEGRKFIYLSGEKIIINSSHGYDYDVMTEEQIKDNNLLFGGLKDIEKMTKSFYFSCFDCDFAKEKLEINNETYQVCSYYNYQ